jgi:phenylalanyl-tRNA synthetase beta chain
MIPEALNAFFGHGVKLTAPLTQEMAVLRASVLPGLLTAIKNNQHKSQFNNAFFEMAHQFNRDDQGGVVQPLMLAAVRSQAACDKTWHTPSRSVDVFDSKADLFALLEAAQINPLALTVEAQAPAYYHPGRSGSLKQGPRVLGYFGEIHPEVVDSLGIKGPVVACELFMDVITANQRKKSTLSQKLSPFQPTQRDFGFVMDRTHPADSLLKAIQKVDRALIKQVDLFDVFEGAALPTGKKALAVRVHVQSDVFTLTDETLTQLSQKIVAAAQQACGAVLRDGSNS